MIIIDEIPVASNMTLQDMHKSLCEISGCSEASPFAGKTIILFGDHLQLPPVKSQQAFVPLQILYLGQYVNFGQIS